MFELRRDRQPSLLRARTLALLAGRLTPRDVNEMCGKFTQMISWSELVWLSDLQPSSSGDVETITPMRFASVIACDHEGRRKAVRMRWGLVPAGAKDPMAVKPHIHARAESIEVKPTFRDAFLRRRGLVVVTTFNEGREITPTKTEQHVLTPLDGKPVAIAVIWERWSERQGSSLLSFAMVTVSSTEQIEPVTDRMPALIEGPDWAKWLGEEPATVDALKALLRPSERGLDLRKAAKPPPKPKPDQPDLF